MMNEVKLYNEIATDCSFASVSRCARVVGQLFDDAFQPVGLTAGQFTLLIAVAVAQKISIKPLAKQLVMDRTTLARNLRPLEREGLIHISVGSDQRQRLIQLTEHGQTILDRAIPLWGMAQEQVITHLGFERWRAFMGELADMVTIAIRKKG